MKKWFGPETVNGISFSFALASHFFWFLWSIVQEEVSKIDFGYLVSNIVQSN